MSKIKILFIHHGTGIGGAPISLLNLIKQLDKDKFNVKVAFIKGGVAEEMFRANNIRTEVLNTSNVWFAHNQTGKIQFRYFYRYFRIYKHWQFTAKTFAREYLSKQEADIVHLNSHVLTSWAYAAKREGKKVVLHNREAVARGYFGLRYKILKRLISENCDHIINISKDNFDRLGIKKNASIIYNFVDIPQTFRPSMSTPSEGIKILFLGGMARIKGFKTAAESLPFLNPGIKIQFAGSLGSIKKGKTLKEKLVYWVKINFYNSYNLLEKLQRNNKAEIVGLLKDPLPVIDACDILITPFKIEHFSRPAVEAFAYGKPVIGSNVVGMDEIIDPHVNGLLVEKNNPKALADAINYLCSNPGLAAQMGSKGREKAYNLFSPQKNTRMVESIYYQLMNSKA